MSDSENCLILHLSDDLLDHLIGEMIHTVAKTEKESEELERR